MALTRSYKETVLKRIRDDGAFATALYAQAVSALLEGEQETALSILRDLVHARLSMKRLAEQTGMNEKSLHRILSVRGNPTMSNLLEILTRVRKDLGVNAAVSVQASALPRRVGGGRRAELVFA